MRNLLLKMTSFLFIAIMIIGTVNAQSTTRELKKDLKSKVEKECRKTAKQLKKNGWLTMPGKLLIERQIQESRFAELEQNEDGEKKYFTSNQSVVGGNYSAAKKMATSRSIVELAEQISVKVASIVENNTSNLTLSPEDIEIIDKCIATSKQTVSTKLSGASPVLEIYKEMSNGTIKMQMMYKMNSENALKIAKNIYRAELEKETKSLSMKLDELL